MRSWNISYRNLVITFSCCRWICPCSAKAQTWLLQRRWGGGATECWRAQWWPWEAGRLVHTQRPTTAKEVQDHWEVPVSRMDSRAWSHRNGTSFRSATGLSVLSLTSSLLCQPWGCAGLWSIHNFPFGSHRKSRLVSGHCPWSSTSSNCNAFCRELRSMFLWRGGSQAKLLQMGDWGRCHHPPNTHVALIGRQEDGSFFTARAKVYPAGLNMILGQAMYTFASRLAASAAVETLPDAFEPYLE